MLYTAFVPFQSLFFDYVENRQPHNMQVLHYHDCYEIYLQTKGERFFFLDGNCYSCKPGDIYILKPYHMHYAQSLSSAFYARYVLNFHAEQLEMLLTPTERKLLCEKLESGILHLNPEQYHQALLCFQGLASCYQQEGFLKQKLQYTYVLQLLLLLRDSMSRTANQPADVTSHDIKPEILQAINYINRNYNQPISLDDITNKVHMSKYYFCRLFHDTTGSTFLEYLNKVRLSKTHQMLLETEKSLANIAAETGFSSSVNLSRVFHSVYGMSPSEFRKQNARPKYRE